MGEVIDSGANPTPTPIKIIGPQFRPRAAPSPTGRIGSSPSALWPPWSILETGNDWEDSNDCSVVAQLTCGNVQVLFTGDMSQQVETKLLPLFGDIDVLKVSHHGSDTASCAEFLSVVKPEYAVISYGLDNAYHHPAGETLQRLFDVGATVYGTGKSGSIVLTTDGWTYSFNTSQALTAADAGV